MKNILTNEEWNQKALIHKERIEELTKTWRESQKDGKSHPVIDFLFKYFSFPYNRLRAWTPGLGVKLEAPLTELLSENRFEENNGLIQVKESLFPHHRLKAIEWTLSLLKKTNENKACFSCYGLHEWAMVYKTKDIRHKLFPFRLSDKEIENIVEEKPLLCTHYDAIRFYTEASLPMNRYLPTRETQEDYEQSACLHSNMDLYKWTYKMYPWISSDLLLDAFELAMDCRTVDMKASPYDLTHLGYEPIKIETPEGRDLYVKEQSRLKEKAAPIRLQLIEYYQELELHLNGSKREA